MSDDRWARYRALEPDPWSGAQSERVRLAVARATVPHGREYPMHHLAWTTWHALFEARGTLRPHDRDSVRGWLREQLDDTVPHGVLRVVRIASPALGLAASTEDVVLWAREG